MAIADVRRNDSIIEIFDEHGLRTGVMTLGRDSVINSFTSTSINVQTGSLVYVYDEKGQHVGVL